jgi:hypothetical protein
VSTFKDWALHIPERHRVAHTLLYTSPDGKLYMAPIGTDDPDPDRPLSPEWTEIQVVRDREEDQ